MKACCETCVHFYRHYVRREADHYHVTAFGHCPHPRIKIRSASTPACPRYQAREEQKPGS